VATLLQWAPATAECVFWFVVDHVAGRWTEDPQAWYDLTPEQRTVFGLPYPTDVDTREEVLDAVLAADPFRLDGVDAAMVALERDQPCDGLLDAWVWSHHTAFFDG
jgi:hypothetical protein